ncbi:MAG: hypothetical protein AAFQ89_14080 [Cyanobacteria bacterium J06626_18]
MTNTVSSSPSAGDASQPIEGLRSTLAGFTSTHLEEADELAPIAQQILDDPVALEKLSDRVFELFKQDIRAQRERSGSYRR